MIPSFSRFAAVGTALITLGFVTALPIPASHQSRSLNVVSGTGHDAGLYQRSFHHGCDVETVFPKEIPHNEIDHLKKLGIDRGKLEPIGSSLYACIFRIKGGYPYENGNKEAVLKAFSVSRSHIPASQFEQEIAALKHFGQLYTYYGWDLTEQQKEETQKSPKTLHPWDRNKVFIIRAYREGVDLVQTQEWIDFFGRDQTFLPPGAGREKVQQCTQIMQKLHDKVWKLWASHVEHDGINQKDRILANVLFSQGWMDSSDERGIQFTSWSHSVPMDKNTPLNRESYGAAVKEGSWPIEDNDIWQGVCTSKYREALAKNTQAKLRKLQAPGNYL